MPPAGHYRSTCDTTLEPLLTHEEIGALLGIKPRRVGFIEAKALAKLREAIRALGLTYRDLKYGERRVRVMEERI